VSTAADLIVDPWDVADVHRMLCPIVVGRKVLPA
jgi:hypothetical protein